MELRKEKTSRFEKGCGVMQGLRDLPKYLNGNTITAGAVAAIFGCTGPALLVIKAAQDGKLTHVQSISWLFSIYFIGGLVSIYLALRYKQPINGAFNIPAVVMIVTVLKTYNIYQAAGAYFAAGVIVFLLGYSGLIGKVMKWLPLPIVMAMIAGAMIRFGTGIITSTQQAPVVGLSALVGFFIVPKLTKKVPPVLGALVLGIIAAIANGSMSFKAASFSFVAPQVIVPQFSIGAILSVSIPLAILIIGSENAQAAGVLMAQGYKPPVNAMTMVSGIGSMVTSFFGGHNANIAGPMTAICATEEAGEDKEGRYAASVVNGVLFALFGVVASIALAFVSALPAALTNIIAGLAMINVLYSAFHEAFAVKKFKYGAFFALSIAMSNITIMKIGAPLLAIIGGVIVSLLVEANDFKEDKQEVVKEAA